MKNKMKKFDYAGTECCLAKAVYGNNTLALVVLEVENAMGSPVTVATVNLGTVATVDLDEPNMANNVQYLKNYSENSGLLEALNEAGFIKAILSYRKTGFVEVPLIEFNLDGVLTMDQIADGDY